MIDETNKHEVDATVARTLTVGALIDQLMDFDPETPVLFNRPTGDYWNTMVCDRIEYSDVMPVTWDEYHQSLRIDDPGNWDIDDDDEPMPVYTVEAVVLQ